MPTNQIWSPPEGGPHGAGGTAQEFYSPELLHAGHPGPARAHVDIEHVGTGGAGGDRDIGIGPLRPPRTDLTLVGGGIVEAVGRQRSLAVCLHREHLQPLGGVGECGLEDGAHDFTGPSRSSRAVRVSSSVDRRYRTRPPMRTARSMPLAVHARDSSSSAVGELHAAELPWSRLQGRLQGFDAHDRADLLGPHRLSRLRPAWAVRKRQS